MYLIDIFPTGYRKFDNLPSPLISPPLFYFGVIFPERGLDNIGLHTEA